MRSGDYRIAERLYWIACINKHNKQNNMSNEKDENFKHILFILFICSGVGLVITESYVAGCIGILLGLVGFIGKEGR
jgi:hypothetical protein